MPSCNHQRSRCRPQLPRCCHRAAAAALCAAAVLPPTSRRRAAATAPAVAPPFVGWLLRCCPPSDFVIACRHATIKLSYTASTTATAAAAGLPGRHNRHRHHRGRTHCSTLVNNGRQGWDKDVLIFKRWRSRRQPPPAVATLCDGWLLGSLLSRRSSEHHQQLTNGSTILFTFTFPVNLDLFNLSTVSFGSILASIS